MQRTRSRVSGSSSGSSSVPSRQKATLTRPLEPPPPPPVTPPPVPMPVMQALQPLSPVQPQQPIPVNRYTLNSNKKHKKGREITKADIGKPQDFKHIAHVGWDTSFNLDDAPEADEIRSFFTKAGISETQLQDQETKNFINNFIETHGGLPAFKQDLDKVHRSTRSMVSGSSSGSSSVPSRQDATLTGPPPPLQRKPLPAPPVTPRPMPVMQALQPLQPVQTVQTVQTVQPVQPVQQLQPIPAKRYTLKSNIKQHKEQEITEGDIGMPQDFKHKSHVAWDVNKVFNPDDASEAEKVRSFFKKAGISETELQDPEIREFLYNFIETHGGLPAFKQELDKECRSFEPDTRSRSKMPVTRSTRRRGGLAATTAVETDSTVYANMATVLTAAEETATTSGEPTVAEPAPTRQQPVIATDKSVSERQSKPASSRPSKKEMKARRLARARTELAIARLAEIEAESSDEEELALLVKKTKSFKIKSSS